MDRAIRGPQISAMALEIVLRAISSEPSLTMESLATFISSIVVDSLLEPSLALMLEHPDLQPDVSKRISIMWVLFALHKTDPVSVNPNAHIFAQILKAPVLDSFISLVPYSLTPVERYFATILLTGPPSNALKFLIFQSIHISQLLRRTSQQIVDEFMHSQPPTLPLPDLRPFLRPFPNGQSIVFSIPDPLFSGGDGTNLEALHSSLVNESRWEGSGRCTSSIFGGFSRVAPPLLECSERDLNWLLPSSMTATQNHNPHLLWDYSLPSNLDQGSEVRTLIRKALSGPLSSDQTSFIKAEFEKSPELVHEVGLTPARLRELVDNNPLVAIEFLLRLLQIVSPLSSEYLTSLVTTEMSLHSMEVVNRLTMVVELPGEFMHMYVSNCISTCQKTSVSTSFYALHLHEMDWKDKYMQNRLVRLVCVFLQSLITKEIINIKDQFAEVQSFCVEFSRIKEASALFRFLKTIEHADKLS